MKSKKFVIDKKSQFKIFLDFFSNLFFIYCVIAGIALILFASVTIECQVSGSSMKPTFNNYLTAENKYDTVFVNIYDKDLNYGDIVVCNTDDDPIIKRVIGLPGDVVDILLDDNEYKVELNGKIIEEDYIFVSSDVRIPEINRNGMHHTYEKFQSLISTRSELFNENAKLVVPSDSIFVLGDNRAVSVDSATLGTFSFDEVKGRVEFAKYNSQSSFEFYWNYIVTGQFWTTLYNLF